MARLAGLLKRGYALTGKPSTPDRLHITLHHLGDHVDLAPELVAAARPAASSVAIPPFEVVFDRVATFSGAPGDRPLVLRGGDSTVPLQRAIGAAMAKVGLGASSIRTIRRTSRWRGEGIVEEQTVETFRGTVREFVLVNSLVGETRYVRLGHWPLSGGTA